MIPRKLLIFQLAELAALAAKCGFGSFDMQTRYSDSASGVRTPVLTVRDGDGRGGLQIIRSASDAAGSFNDE